jgi:hypothetical protein
MNAIHFGTNRRFWLWRALGAILMGAIACAMCLKEGLLTPSGWFGLAGVLFFGAAAVIGIWQGTLRGPRLTLDEDGVHDRTLMVGVISWYDIVGVEPYGVAGQPFVGLHLRDPSKYFARASRLGRILARVNAGAGFPFSLNLVGLNADPSEVVDLIVAARSNYQALPLE